MFSCVRALSQKPPQTKTQSQDSASQVNGVILIVCMYVCMYWSSVHVYIICIETQVPVVGARRRLYR